MKPRLVHCLVVQKPCKRSVLIWGDLQKRKFLQLPHVIFVVRCLETYKGFKFVRIKAAFGDKELENFTGKEDSEINPVVTLPPFGNASHSTFSVCVEKSGKYYDKVKFAVQEAISVYWSSKFTFNRSPFKDTKDLEKFLEKWEVYTKSDVEFDLKAEFLKFIEKGKMSKFSKFAKNLLRSDVMLVDFS